MSVLGDFLIKETEKMMDFHKRQASGEAVTSLYERRTQNGFDILGAEHWKYVNEGRNSGKRPPKDTIIKWIKDKGITPKDISVESLAFLIARKIGDEGVPNSGGGVKANQLKISTQVYEKNKEQLKEIAKATLLENFKLKINAIGNR
jgi:hypothetical protein